MSPDEQPPARRHHEWICASSQGCLRRPDLNAIDLRIICGARCKVDGDRTGAVGNGEEGLLCCGIFTPSRSKYVVIVKHLLVVDGDIEETCAGRGPVGFREVEIDNISTACRESWNRIGHRSVAVGLINRLRRRVGGEGRVDSGTS